MWTPAPARLHADLSVANSRPEPPVRSRSELVSSPVGVVSLRVGTDRIRPMAVGAWVNAEGVDWGSVPWPGKRRYDQRFTPRAA